MPALPPADLARALAQRTAIVAAATAGSDITRLLVHSDGGQYPWSFDVAAETDGAAPVIRGRLIVRRDQLEQVGPIIGAGGFGEVQSDCLDRLGLVQLDSSNGVDDLVGYARSVRGAGLQASLDPVLPLNKWTMKGDGGAEPTLRSLGRRPASSRGRGVTVAVIDSGINKNTVDERGRRGRTDGWLSGIGQNPSNRDPLTSVNDALGHVMPGTGQPYLDAAAGHGTFVAGIIRRVAPAAKVKVYRAFTSEGLADDISVACAILQAKDDGADVINLSLGAETLDGRPPLASTTAIQSLPARVAVVAAAGNTGLQDRVYPAALPRVIAVAALDTKGRRRAPFSTYGDWVDASTVGEGVVSTYVDGVEYPGFDPNLPDSFSGRNPIAMWSGTSFAAPQLAGLLARNARVAGSPTRAFAKLKVRYAATVAPGLGVRLRILP